MKFKLTCIIFLAVQASFAQNNTFPSSGNVGIGTISPQYKMQLEAGHGDSNFNLHFNNVDLINDAHLTLWASEPGWTYTGAGIGNNVFNSSTSAGVIRINNLRGGSYMRLLNQEIRMNVVKHDGSDIIGLSVNPEGFAGIGTINPTSKLQVAGIGNFRYDESNYGYLSINPGNSTTQGYLNWWKPGNVRVAYMGYNDGVSSNNLGLTLEANANFIVNGGNVGIGTTTPIEKLAVNGNIRAKEIKVETTNWPDYVFDQDYKVLGLNELDAYIKANKHLPEIPSATTAEKEGIKLGEMNNLLLKKIEELTLHLIQKDQEILQLKKLEGRVWNLESKLEKLSKK